MVTESKKLSLLHKCVWLSFSASQQKFVALLYPAWFHEITFVPLNNASYSTKKPAGATDNS